MDEPGPGLAVDLPPEPHDVDVDDVVERRAAGGLAPDLAGDLVARDHLGLVAHEELEQLELARRTLRLINVWEPHRGYLVTCRKRLGIYNAADGLSLENLLQSHTGVIHVFPVVPEDFEGGFENLGAQGAFVVAGERLKNGMHSVTIKSVAGNPCALANPWPAARAQVVDLDAAQPIPVTLDKHTIRFETKANRRYRITNR